VFTDGLAFVSLFVEAFDPASHGKSQRDGQLAMGATHMQTQRLGDWWLTAVGEVPQQTLQRFAQSLERKR
jgi:sigma-E factor negative regulatory protein RseB